MTDLGATESSSRFTHTEAIAKVASRPTPAIERYENRTFEEDVTVAVLNERLCAHAQCLKLHKRLFCSAVKTVGAKRHAHTVNDPHTARRSVVSFEN